MLLSPQGQHRTDNNLINTGSNNVIVNVTTARKSIAIKRENKTDNCKGMHHWSSGKSVLCAWTVKLD